MTTITSHCSDETALGAGWSVIGSVQSPALLREILEQKSREQAYSQQCNEEITNQTHFYTEIDRHCYHQNNGRAEHCHRATR